MSADGERRARRARAELGHCRLLPLLCSRRPLSLRLSLHRSATLLWRKDFKPDITTWADVADLNTGRLELLDRRDNAGRPINFFRLR